MALTGDREFRNETIRIADLTVISPVIEGYTFSNCKLLGPAVVVLQGDVTITSCTNDHSPTELFWEIGPEREFVVGAVVIKDCALSACSLEGIGFAGHSDLLQLMEQDLAERD